MNFRQLDEQLKQFKTSNLLLLNQIGEQEQMARKARQHNVWLMLTGGVLILLIGVLRLEHGWAALVQIAVALLTLMVTIWALLRNNVNALVSCAFVMGINSIYQLFVPSLTVGYIRSSSIALSILYFLGTLYYIQQANRYRELGENVSSSDLSVFYNYLADKMQKSQPNASNKLIKLKQFRQEIIVWLRPSSVVIWVAGEKRLFVDVTQSFHLKINGEDKGSETLSVNAAIIDQTLSCSISRHDWLRYMQFVRN